MYSCEPVYDFNDCDVDNYDDVLKWTY